MCIVTFLFCFFFFKQKTAYEMRISDWSSDVCSSDLPADVADRDGEDDRPEHCRDRREADQQERDDGDQRAEVEAVGTGHRPEALPPPHGDAQDRKSTRLNSSH